MSVSSSHPNDHPLSHGVRETVSCTDDAQGAGLPVMLMGSGLAPLRVL